MHLVLSGVLCTKCIEKGLERLLPRDLALEVEEAGPACTFLGCEIRVSRRTVHVSVHATNLAYALGESPFPRKSRAP
eukprot:15463940-Alexandrium_andersonii.AAC.1